MGKYLKHIGFRIYFKSIQIWIYRFPFPFSAISYFEVCLNVPIHPSLSVIRALCSMRMVAYHKASICCLCGCFEVLLGLQCVGLVNDAFTFTWGHCGFRIGFSASVLMQKLSVVCWSFKGCMICVVWTHYWDPYKNVYLLSSEAGRCWLSCRQWVVVLLGREIWQKEVI